MRDYRYLDPIVCIVTKAYPDMGAYEVVVKENGVKGMMMCSLRTHLSEGQEITAQFCKIDHNGQYLLYGPSSDLNIVKPSEGAKIIKFPSREKET